MNELQRQGALGVKSWNGEVRFRSRGRFRTVFTQVIYIGVCAREGDYNPLSKNLPHGHFARLASK